MNKKELSTAHKLILWTLFYAIILVGVFFLMKFTFTDRTAKLKSENRSLKEEYEMLQMYVANEDYYKGLTDETNQASIDILNAYISDITKKGTIHKFEEQLLDYDLKTASISLGENTELLNVLLNDVEYRGLMTQTSISYNMSYETFKKWVRDIIDEDQNISIHSFSISEDTETGNLTGTLTLAEYAVNGSEKLYEEPDIDMHVGEESIFNMIELDIPIGDDSNEEETQ